MLIPFILFWGGYLGTDVELSGSPVISCFVGVAVDALLVGCLGSDVEKLQEGC